MHSDLLFEVAFWRTEPNPFGNRWLGNLTEGDVGLQVCAVGADLDGPVEGILRTVLLQIAACHRAVQDNAERVALVRAGSDLNGNRVGLLLALEGAEPLGADPDLVDAFWALGVRMVSLTWNRRNLLGDGVGERSPGGLSDAGVRVVERLAAIGMVIDLAHAAGPTFSDILRHAPEAPIVVSHGACRAVHESPRNLSDAQLREVAARGGVLGVMGHPLAIDPARPTVDRLVDHVLHATGVMGIEHVGLGGDFMHQIANSGALQTPLAADAVVPVGFARDATIEGLRGPQDYRRLVEGLERRGVAGADLASILSGNVLRFLAGSLPH